MENINFELYKVFYFVAINKNITKASNILLISQPAITQTIKKLEDNLGYKLFYRTSRGMELTIYGEKLLDSIRSSIECLDNSKKYLDSLDNIPTTLRVGGGITLLKHNALDGFIKFNQKYPFVKLEIIRDITSKLLEKLENNLLDLVLFNMPVEANEDIVIEKIEDVEFIFAAETRKFKSLSNKKVSLKEIIDYPLILQSEVTSGRKFFNSIIKKNKLTVKDTFELESYDLVLSFVKAGLGIGFINKNHVRKELENNELFEIDIDTIIPKREIGIAYNKKNINNKYIKEFIDDVKK